MREIEYSAGYDNSLKQHLKKRIKDYGKDYVDYLIDDLEALKNILLSGARIPDRYKPHKLQSKGGLIDCHLVSRGSDDILFFRKEKRKGVVVITMVAVGDHKFMNQLRASLIDDEDLLIDPEDLYA